MNVHIIEAWATLGASVAAFRLVAGLPRRWANRIERKALEFKGKAVADYIETGIGMSTVTAFDRRTVKAAVRERAARLSEKSREAKEFKAVCECPKCGLVAVHWLVGHKRVCRNEECRYEWKQT